jgi:hypothetical protein
MSEVTRYWPMLVGKDYWMVPEKPYNTEWPAYVHASDYDALASRVAELEKDAARYRYIKQRGDDISFDTEVCWRPAGAKNDIYTSSCNPFELDTFLDAAMSARQPAADVTTAGGES